MLGLNMAHIQDLAAGKDIVFTYGPFGYLQYPAPAATGSFPVLVYSFGLYTVWLVALARLAFVLRPRHWAAWAIGIFGFAALLGLSIHGTGVAGGGEPDHLLLALIALALLAFVDEKLRWFELIALAALSGFAATVKINVGVEAFLLVTGIAALTVRSKSIVIISVFMCSLTAFYILGTGKILSLASYLRYGWEIGSGYSLSMSWPGNPFILTCALMSLGFLLGAVPAFCRPLRAVAPALVPAAIVAFCAFKLAMVRQDIHALSFQRDIALAALFPLVSATRAWDRRIIAVFQVVSLLLALCMSALTLPLHTEIISRLSLGWAKTTATSLLNWHRVRQDIALSDRDLRKQQRLGPEFYASIGNGTIDAFPVDVALIRANGWRWQPRPVFQSYSTYTPALDRLNAAHLESSRAADFALIEWTGIYGTPAIDSRHPFLEDPLSWRALLERYDVRLKNSRCLLLARRSAPRQFRLSTPSSLDARWDERITLPAHRGLFIAQAQIRQNPLGSLCALLFRVAPVYIDVSYASGAQARWRAVWPNLDEGFIADPMPGSLEGLASLFERSEYASGRVNSIVFHSDCPAEFQPRIRLRWFAADLQ